MSSKESVWYPRFLETHLLTGLTLIPAWITDYIPRKVWDEITYLALNFNGDTGEV